MLNIFITGIAGMIGFHLSKHLQTLGHAVSGIDNFNDYYDVQLKEARADILKSKNISVYVDDLLTADYSSYLGNVDLVIHLAAYANPRHSLEFPQLYIDNNISGTQRLIDACEKYKIKKVIYASSSCVQHGQPLPWKEEDRPLHQNNPYGWSKHVNECQFTYSKIPSTVGLRFFTVYGPLGRPDMALFMFTKNIIEGVPITVFNNGNMKRDFTYVDDIVQGITCLLEKENQQHELYNIGYGKPVPLMDFIHAIENEVGKKAIIEYKPMHPADILVTWADTSKIQREGYQPSTPVDQGIKKFVSWYRNFYDK